MSQLVFGVRMNAPRSGCPINLTLEALGDRWSLIVIRDLMFGHFSAMGCPPKLRWALPTAPVYTRQ
jgi:hypothetical protein